MHAYPLNYRTLTDQSINLQFWVQRLCRGILRTGANLIRWQYPRRTTSKLYFSCSSIH
jgi:hypothetical protein